MKRTLLATAVVFLLGSACTSSSTDTTTAPPAASEATTSTAPLTSQATTATTTSTTVAPTTTTTLPLAAGTMEDPVPPGVWATVGTMTAVVLANEPNATAAVLAENEFNEEPAAGNQFVLWRVAVTNHGNEPTQLFAKVSFSVVGPSSVAYDASAYCGVVPDQLDEFRDVFPGGTIEGNLCWEVAAEDAGELRLLVDGVLTADTRTVFDAAGTSTPLAVDYPTPNDPESDGPVGTRGNPHSIGDTVAVGDWSITVTGAIPNATVDVLGESPLNDSPPSGRQYSIVGIEATYTGTESDLLVISTSFNTVGPLGVAYTGTDFCGVLPDELDVFAEAFPGGTVAGNLCWSVKKEDADDLLLYVQESISFDGERHFFELG